MSIMVNGGNSAMTHSVRTCTTMTMRRTTGNLTTTIPTALWYCAVVIYIFASLYKCLSLFGHNFNLFQAEATSESSEEYFDSVLSLLKARKDMNSKNAGVSFGIYYVEVGLKGSRESEFLQNLTRYKSQVCSTHPQVNVFYMQMSTITFV